MFFTFDQNNSGGSFDVDDNVTAYVIIEAENADEANERAEAIGIYFNGVDEGFDCECCGDRWYPAWGKGDKTPSIYGKNPEDSPSRWIKGKPYCYVYYKNGTKNSFTGK